MRASSNIFAAKNFEFAGKSNGIAVDLKVKMSIGKVS